jgi:hypothetical protein
MEHDLQQQVSELVLQALGVAGVDRLEGLVGLLEQVLSERLMRLLGVPGATARASEPRCDLQQIEHAISTVVRRRGALRNAVGGPTAFFAHRRPC